MKRTSYIIRDSLVPVVLSWFFPVAAITIGPIIFIRKGYGLDLRLLVHEEIHVLQGRELFFVGFWFLYLYYWLWNLWDLRDAEKAYRAIPFEREAYANEDRIDYLRTRRPHSWKQYL